MIKQFCTSKEKETWIQCSSLLILWSYIFSCFTLQPKKIYVHFFILSNFILYFIHNLSSLYWHYLFYGLHYW